MTSVPLQKGPVEAVEVLGVGSGTDRIRERLKDCTWYTGGAGKLEDERQIIRYVWKELASAKARAAFPNTYAVLDRIECDLLTWLADGRAHEWEIKRTAADFRKDVEKVWKRELYTRTAGGQLSAELGRKDLVPNLYTMVLVGGRSWLKDRDLELIPPYAGVVMIDRSEGESRPTITRWQNPKALHKEKVGAAALERLFVSICHRFMGRPEDNPSWEGQADDYVI